MGPKEMSSSSDILRRALEAVRARSSEGTVAAEARVTLNFHPDMPVDGRMMLERMSEEGVYRSQFETGTSNGGLTAFPGGDRWAWESRIFDGAYDGADPSLRPKYGGLNRGSLSFGAAPRFGSAHLRLFPHVLERTTFCYPDSVFEPVHFGVAERMGLIDLSELQPPTRDPLDDYVEAHVHGPVELFRDVEAIVLDPCYRGTQIERWAKDLPVRLEWHQGFALRVEVGCADCAQYRGAEIAHLAHALSRDGWLTPDLIGAARATGQYALQDLKQVWHCLARFGGGSWFRPIA